MSIPGFENILKGRTSILQQVPIHHNSAPQSRPRPRPPLPDVLALQGVAITALQAICPKHNNSAPQRLVLLAVRPNQKHLSTASVTATSWCISITGSGYHSVAGSLSERKTTQHRNHKSNHHFLMHKRKWLSWHCCRWRVLFRTKCLCTTITSTTTTSWWCISITGSGYHNIAGLSWKNNSAPESQAHPPLPVLQEVAITAFLLAVCPKQKQLSTSITSATATTTLWCMTQGGHCNATTTSWPVCAN